MIYIPYDLHMIYIPYDRYIFKHKVLLGADFKEA